MRISAYLEAGIDNKASDERLYIKYYHYTEDGNIEEGGTLVLQEGECDAVVDVPFIMALADGREEYPGPCIASETVIQEMKKFRMPVFLNTRIKKAEKKAEPEKVDMVAEGSGHASGGVAFVNGSLGGIKKDEFTLQDMQNMGNMGDLTELNAEEGAEEEQLKDFEPDEEKIGVIKKFLGKVNENVIEAGRQPWGEYSMAACTVGFVCTKDQSFMFNMGNLKVLRKKGLSDYWETISKSHTERVGDSKRKKITCLMGSDENRAKDMQVEDYSVIAGEGKKMAIVGEGIYKYVDLRTLSKLMKEKEPPLSICRNIANAARDNGSAKDISIVLFNFYDEPEEDKE